MALTTNNVIVLIIWHIHANRAYIALLGCGFDLPDTELTLDLTNQFSLFSYHLFFTSNNKIWLNCLP